MLERSGKVKYNLSLRLPTHLKPRRFPKGEPKPQQVKSMTIAAGFRCFDGVVLCSDSEHTEGQSKFYDTKIFEVKANNAVLYLTGAGDYVYIRSVAEEIKSLLNGRDASLDQIKAVFEDTVSETYSHRLGLARQAGDLNPPTMLFLVALWVDGDKKAKIYRIAETGGVSEATSECTTIGIESAETLVRELADLLLRGRPVSVFAVRHLAVYIINRVVRFASYVGGSAQVACIADGGITYSDNSASSDPGRDYLSELLCDLPPIIEGFISGHVDEEAMKRFTERVHEAAGKRKSWHHPMEINGWNW